MTTDPTRLDALQARLAVSTRQRQFEWTLARIAQSKAAGELVRGKTHDLLNLVQIVQLATLQLEDRCDATAQEFLVDLTQAAASAQASLTELMMVARPDDAVVKGAPIGPVIEAAVAALGAAVRIDVQLDAEATATTRCSASQLEHLLIGLALDLIAFPPTAGVVAPDRVLLQIRQRLMGGRPFLEILRSTTFIPPGDRFELKTVECIAELTGGEISVSEGRGGVEDVVVAVPIVP